MSKSPKCLLVLLFLCFSILLFAPFTFAEYVLVISDMEEQFVGDSSFGSDFPEGIERNAQVIAAVLKEIEKAKQVGARILFLEWSTDTVSALKEAVDGYEQAVFLLKKEHSRLTQGNEADGAPLVAEYFRENKLDFKTAKLKLVGVSLFCCVDATAKGLKPLCESLALILRATDGPDYFKKKKSLPQIVQHFKDLGLQVDETDIWWSDRCRTSVEDNENSLNSSSRNSPDSSGGQANNIKDQVPHVKNLRTSSPEFFK